ncbi:hypothetical protein DWQ65_02510 [Treponema phagedenis]|uniref:DUF5723 domain-containing protein n=2 Tax=Treponema phagedenis TaxID=162 RepID=A0A0B7GU13_TREPH|nr:DUF5723 family protein [Treponema phagedenis]QEJ94421.1 hypothetical protein FUT79_03830 [Treponema phagedenis]QEJ96664.1 hypothetical protein FUT82_00655 [Treponema phagedenis]QEK02733.1 hypothetical protein FUT83_02190 [Treponema phagedenis]QSH95027.1 hypothetical protein C5O78_08250 [Treponema phagedenis]QSH98966.1 hypothetical protein DWQ65_02510 [Treponema phagedenis]
MKKLLLFSIFLSISVITIFAEEIELSKYQADEGEFSVEPIIIDGIDEEEEIVIPQPKEKRPRAFSLRKGLSVSATAANSAIHIPDFFKETLVVDLTKIAKQSTHRGFEVGAFADVTDYTTMTFFDAHSVTFSISANMYAWQNIPKNVLDFLGKGNKGISEISGHTNGRAEAYAEASLLYKMKKQNYGIYIKGNYFCPIFFQNGSIANYVLKTDQETGKITISTDVDALIYTPLPIFNNEENITPRQLAKKILKNGGFDVTVGGEYIPTDWATVNFAVTHLPIVPTFLDKGMNFKFHFDAEVDNFLNNLEKETKEYIKYHSEQADPVYSLPKKRVMRTCKLWAGADFRPLKNNYLILSTSIGLPIVNAKPYYADFKLKLESKFAKVLGAYLSLSYLDRIWQNEICFYLDSRWAVFSLAVSLASNSFARNFYSVSGAGVKLGLALGF